MLNRLLMVGALAAAVALPAVARADDVRHPAEDAGEAAGAAAGAIVGGTIGAAGAIVGGILDPDRPRFHEYVVREHHPSFHYDRDVVVGTVLPPTVEYYEVPREYHVTRYRYAVVNDRTVLVDPGTRRVVEVIN